MNKIIKILIIKFDVEGIVNGNRQCATNAFNKPDF